MSASICDKASAAKGYVHAIHGKKEPNEINDIQIRKIIDHEI